MKTDGILQEHAIHSLQQASAIYHCKIVVVSNNGIITRSDIIEHYTK
jgi:hypothetical protein